MKLVLITALAALCLLVGTVSSNYYYGSYYPYNQNQGSGGWMGSKTFCFVGFIISRVALTVESTAQGLTSPSSIWLSVNVSPGWLSVCLSVIPQCVDLAQRATYLCSLNTLVFWGYFLRSHKCGLWLRPKPSYTYWVYATLTVADIF